MAVSSFLLNQVQELYIAFYDRPADLGGLNYWANVVATDYNGNVQGILQDFAQSQESQNLYGTITSSNVGTVINQIYLNLFNRGVDPTGLQYWTNAYNTYHMSAGELAYYILNGAQGTDTTTIYNKLYAANVFTQTMANNYTTDLIPTAHNFINAVTATTDLTQITPSSVNSYTQSFQTSTYNLTSGVDTLVGSNPVNDVFNGTYNTWGPGDQITGAQGANNTFNLTDDRSSPTTIWNLNPALSSVSGVQNVNVASQTAVSIDTTKWSGVTNLTITASDSANSANNSSTVTAAATTNVNFTDSNLGSNTDTITGGQNVVVNEYSVDGGKVVDGNSAAATPTLGTITAISLNGVSASGATITDNNLQTLTVNDAVSGATVTINDNSAVSGVPTALTLNVSNDGLNTTPATITESDSNSGKGQYTTLNVVTGAKSSNLALSGFNAVTALNVSGSSTLTLSSLTTTTPVLSTVAISGAAGFTANNSGAAVLPKSLTSITDSSSGVVNVVMPTNLTNTATTASFDGSTATGQEIVGISQPLASTASIKGGTATNNELVILPSANFATSSTTGAINSFGAGTISGFEVLGIYDTSSTGYSFDIAALGAQLGSFNNTIDLLSVAGTDTLYNLANSSTLQFDSYSNVTGSITAQFSGTSGATDTANVVFSHTLNDGISVTVPSLTFQDSATTPNGIGTLNITDTTVAKNTGDTITTLTDNSLTTLNINSNNAFTIGTLNDTTTSPVSINLSGAGQFKLGTTNMSLSTSTLTITDNSANTSATTITTLTDNSLTTLNLAGTHAAGITIGTLNDTTTSPVSINLSGAGQFKLGTTNMSLSTSTLTITDNSTNTNPTTITTLTDNALTTLNLAGTHMIDINSGSLGSSAKAGLSITSTNTAGVNIGSSTTLLGISNYAFSTNNFFNFTPGNNTLYLTTTPTSAAQTNNFTFGNGNNTLNLTSSANGTTNQNVTNNITVGSGSNTITLTDTNGTSTKVSNTITLASPNHDINHYTQVTDSVWSDLVLTFSNTINPNNSSASSIAAISVSGTTLLADLNQAIASTSVTNPFAYFQFDVNNDKIMDTVIVDHSAANTGTTFVPGQDAFIVLLGTSTVAAPTTLSVSSGHIIA